MTDARLISIHAPRTGSDASATSGAGTQTISIHAPRTGSDNDDFLCPASEFISIHAPRTGSDDDFSQLADFDTLFQSTLPARGATIGILHRGGGHQYFNPRSPHGERREQFPFTNFHEQFQSTLPARGATAYLAIDAFAENISIHAPRTGSDSALRRRRRRASSIFQSTLPARGATLFGGVFGRGDIISIHAPRTGSDGRVLEADALTIISIHAPRTGSDGIWSENVPMALNFNPRSPHGERHSAGNSTSSGTRISIHAPRTGSDVFVGARI